MASMQGRNRGASVSGGREVNENRAIARLTTYPDSYGRKPPRRIHPDLYAVKKNGLEYSEVRNLLLSLHGNAFSPRNISPLAGGHSLTRTLTAPE